MAEENTVVESSDEITYFNVRNNSLRLVHIAGAAIAPGLVGRIIDDKLGINRKSIESEDYLEETDDESEEELKEAQAEAAKPAVKAKTGKSSKTGSGTKW